MPEKYVRDWLATRSFEVNAQAAIEGYIGEMENGAPMTMAELVRLTEEAHMAYRPGFAEASYARLMEALIEDGYMDTIERQIERMLANWKRS